MIRTLLGTPESGDWENIRNQVDTTFLAASFERSSLDFKEIDDFMAGTAKLLGEVAVPEAEVEVDPGQQSLN